MVYISVYTAGACTCLVHVLNILTPNLNQVYFFLREKYLKTDPYTYFMKTCLLVIRKTVIACFICQFTRTFSTRCWEQLNAFNFCPVYCEVFF